MKRAISVDASSETKPTVVSPLGYTADITEAHKLLHGQDSVALGDRGYGGVAMRKGLP